MLRTIMHFLFAVTCPFGYYTYSGSCYYIGSQLSGVLVASADTKCDLVVTGARLASIHTVGELEYVTSLIAP